MDKKTLVLFIVAIGLMGFFLFSSYSLHPLATDSGFDTSYDSGGSSGWSGGGSSYGGGGSGDHYHSGSGSGTLSDESVTVILIIFVLLYLAATYIEYYEKSKLLFFVSLLFTILTGVVLLIDVGMGLLCGISLFSIFKVIKIFDSHDDVPSHYNEKAFRVYSEAKKNKPPLTEENKQILKDGYQVYLDVQAAWMNFDYDALRTLVTDELFNMYQNQLQTLQLKGQQNIMDDFQFVSSELLKIKKEEGITTILMELEVQFYDYIIDNKKKKIRGSKRKKVVMDYLLTFVSSEVEKKCPHCGAQLEDGKTICEYCHTHIQSVTRTMKLSKKEVLSQKMR